MAQADDIRTILRDIGEIKGSVATIAQQVKGINGNLTEQKANCVRTTGEIFGRLSRAEKWLVALVVVAVLSGGGVGLAKVLALF